MIGYYAGLLHDIGKLNPYYQKLFAEKNHNKGFAQDLERTYGRIHAPYSAWLAKEMLDGFTRSQLADTLMLIYKHHGKLEGSLKKFERDVPDVRNHIKENFAEFKRRYQDQPGFAALNWDLDDDFFSGKIVYNIDLASGNENFFRVGFLFSALLHGDKGSFYRQKYDNFDINVDTAKLRKPESLLSKYRTKIQENIIENYVTNNLMAIINAPTGTGKTKAFLDIIAKHGKNFSRVFYFSPLLALTEDFEKKLESCISSSDYGRVLKYNSVTVETLGEYTDIVDKSWNFDYESFNTSFVITTVQRLLMTIYSPRNKDKLKLASFRKSLLIIDEIQTVPSVILGHLIGQLELIAMHLDSRILLVSATIPHSLKDIPKVNIPEGIVKEYLSKTVKNVSVLEKFDIENIADDKYLLMLNTRKKTVSAWHELNDKTLTYVTAGIRKQDKLARINEIANKNTSNKRVISTQAIEAGIDVSFRKIYREMAPLDSIVQVLGRLNRENDEKSGSLLTVFETDGQHRPYSKVEYQTSKKYLQGMTDSQGLYSILPKYYEEIYENNMESRDQAEKLASNVEAMHFGHAWDMVRSLFDNYYDTVFIPDMENWQGTKESLINRRYAESNHLSATLPKPYHEIGRECFDGDLLEKHILLPKKDKLDYIYDKNIGLDKWLVQ